MRNNKANRMQAVNTGMGTSPKSLGNIGARFDKGKGLTRKAERKLNNRGYTDDMIMEARQAGGGKEGFQNALLNSGGQTQSPSAQDMEMAPGMPEDISIGGATSGAANLPRTQIDKSVFGTPGIQPTEAEKAIYTLPQNKNYQPGYPDTDLGMEDYRMKPQVMPSRGTGGFTVGTGSFLPGYPQMQGDFRRPGRIQAGGAGMGIGSYLSQLQGRRPLNTRGYR